MTIQLQAYLESGTEYYAVRLPNLILFTKDGLKLSNTTLKMRLLTYAEIYKCSQLEGNVTEQQRNEEIFKTCFLGILGYSGVDIDIEKSPAGLIDQVSNLVFNESLKILKNMPDNFNACIQTISEIEVVAAYVSNTLSTPYEEVIKYPVDRILRLYSISHIAFKIPPIVVPEETESKIA